MKYIKQATSLIQREFDGDIPNTVEGLMRLPGVGPKMAHLAMDIAWNQVSGIGTEDTTNSEKCEECVASCNDFVCTCRCGHPRPPNLKQARLDQEGDEDTGGDEESAGGVVTTVTSFFSRVDNGLSDTSEKLSLPFSIL